MMSFAPREREGNMCTYKLFIFIQNVEGACFTLAKSNKYFHFCMLLHSQCYAKSRTFCHKHTNVTRKGGGGDK
jgi:hypothetical protein